MCAKLLLLCLTLQPHGLTLSGSSVHGILQACVCLQCGRPRFNPWVGRIPWRRQWQPTPALLPGESQGWRSLTVCGSDGKASTCNVGDPDSIPGLGGSPGEGNGNPLQYSQLENPKDGGAWRATVHGVPKSQTLLSDFTFFLSFLTIMFLKIILDTQHVLATNLSLILHLCVTFFT